jgi:hypothetical protein
MERQPNPDKPWVVITIGIPQEKGEAVFGGAGELDQPLTAEGIQETVAELGEYISHLLAEQGVIPPIDGKPGEV